MTTYLHPFSASVRSSEHGIDSRHPAAESTDRDDFFTKRGGLPNLKFAENVRTAKDERWMDLAATFRSLNPRNCFTGMDDNVSDCICTTDTLFLIEVQDYL